MNPNMVYLPQLAAKIVISNNSDWRDVFVLTMPDNVTGIDLTDITFQMTIRKSVDALVNLQLSTGDGTLINGKTDGTITFSVPALMLMQMEPDNYVFDFVAHDLDGTIVNLFSINPGELTIMQGVTRDINEIAVDYLSWFLPSLPTEPPQTPGVLWNNNGIMCISGLRESLPTYPPAISGKLWNNGGIVMITSGSQLPSVEPEDTGYLWSNRGVVSLT